MEELSKFLSRGGMADTSTVLEADTISPKQQQQPAVTQPDTKDKDVSIPEFKNSSTYSYWTFVSLYPSLKKVVWWNWIQKVLEFGQRECHMELSKEMLLKWMQSPITFVS